MLSFTTSSNKETSNAVLWKEVGEGWIRYDQCSGSTQLLTPLARFIIDLIDQSSSPLSFSEISNEVLRAEPEAIRSDCDIEVESALRILSEAQLIQRIQS